MTARGLRPRSRQARPPPAPPAGPPNQCVLQLQHDIRAWFSTKTYLIPKPLSSVPAPALTHTHTHTQSNTARPLHIFDILLNAGHAHNQPTLNPRLPCHDLGRLYTYHINPMRPSNKIKKNILTVRDNLVTRHHHIFRVSLFVFVLTKMKIK